MKNKITTILASIVLISTIVTGCGKPVQPFQTSPENAISIKSVDDAIANSQENGKFYQLYSQYKLSLKTPPELKTIIDNDEKKLSKQQFNEKYDPLFKNGDKLVVVNAIFAEKDTEMESGAKKIIDDYITATRENKEMNFKTVGYDLTADFSKENPAQKVKDYMTTNKIVVTSIDFPNTFEAKNLWSYPQVFTYKYTLNGTVNGKAFKKEVAQDFYFEYTFDKSGNPTAVDIAYVKDHAASK